MRKAQRGTRELREQQYGNLQGRPLSAQLFIIYDDSAMEIYTSDVNNAGISKMPNIIRDGKTEHRWANFTVSLNIKT